MMHSRRHRTLWVIAAAWVTMAGLGACAGKGYVVAGDVMRRDAPAIVAASSPLAADARASRPPELEASVLCAPGRIVHSGIAQGGLVSDASGAEGLYTFAGAPLSESRAGFELPVPTEEANRWPLAQGDLIELRAVGRRAGPSAGPPNRLQICRWRPDRSLVGTLWRAGDAGAEVAFELRSPIPATGLRISGKVAVHAPDPRSGWWRMRFVSGRDRVVRVRYAPVGGKALPVRRGQELTLQLLPRDPVAQFTGMAIIVQTPDGEMVATINAGAALSPEQLGGIEIGPASRLAYTEMRQMPSLCVSRVEHRWLKLRTDEGVQEVTPGTYTSFTHRGQRYRLVVYDVAVSAIDDPCAAETVQRLSYAIIRDPTGSADAEPRLPEERAATP